MSATVSIVIPAYNAAPTLARTLDSVAGQTLKPFEVIVVDDGSTDDTRAIARSYAARLPNLTVLFKPNGGVASARNAALDVVKGEFVAPLDADDLLHPTYLDKMMRRVTADPELGFVYCYLRNIDPNDRLLPRSGPLEVNGSGFYRLLLKNYVGSGSNAVFRRTFIQGVGGWNEGAKVSEDFLVQALMTWRHPVAAVPEYLVGYRRHPGSISIDRKLMADGGMENLPRLRKMGAVTRPVDQHEARRLAAATFAYLFRGKLWQAMSFAVRCMSLDLYALPMRVSLKLAGSKKAPELDGRNFYEVDPTEAGTTVVTPVNRRRLAEAIRHDGEHRRHVQRADSGIGVS